MKHLLAHADGDLTIMGEKGRKERTQFLRPRGMHPVWDSLKMWVESSTSLSLAMAERGSSKTGFVSGPQ